MLLLLLLLRSTSCEVIQPHVVYILADDLGWNEVSWNNPGFLTPNLEKLASDGVLLNQSYVSPKCSPSRAALLSGFYPWRLGMQRGAIGEISLTNSHRIKSFLMLPYLRQEGSARQASIPKYVCFLKYYKTRAMQLIW